MKHGLLKKLKDYCFQTLPLDPSFVGKRTGDKLLMANVYGGYLNNYYPWDGARAAENMAKIYSTENTEKSLTADQRAIYDSFMSRPDSKVKASVQKAYQELPIATRHSFKLHKKLHRTMVDSKKGKSK